MIKLFSTFIKRKICSENYLCESKKILCTFCLFWSLWRCFTKCAQNTSHNVTDTTCHEILPSQEHQNQSIQPPSLHSNSHHHAQHQSTQQYQMWLQQCPMYQQQYQNVHKQFVLIRTNNFLNKTFFNKRRKQFYPFKSYPEKKITHWGKRDLQYVFYSRFFCLKHLILSQNTNGLPFMHNRFSRDFFIHNFVQLKSGKVGFKIKNYFFQKCMYPTSEFALSSKFTLEADART